MINTIKKDNDNIDGIDLIKILGLSLSSEEMEIYYQELLKVFLSKFIFETIIHAEPAAQQEIQQGLNNDKNYDEIMAILQKHDLDLEHKFIDFIKKQKELFIMQHIEEVIRSWEEKKRLMKKNTPTSSIEKIARYREALFAAQAEKWSEVEKILNEKPEESLAQVA